MQAVISVNLDKKSSEGLLIKVAYQLAQADVPYTVDYLILNNGSIKVTAAIDLTDKKLPEVPRFGMRLKLNGAYDNLSYYGRGPWENYSDRNTAAFMGNYSDKVMNQYARNYIRPQESGYKTDVRWLTLKNANGQGTVYVDDNDKAYLIHASEDNLTLHISELTADYLDFTEKWTKVASAGHNEAPAVFKKAGVYYMITSGCTGWDPNEARSFKSKSIWGPWQPLGNPCIGEDASLTFHSQSTYILPIEGKKDQFIFMADRGTPDNPIDGTYIWLPVNFDNEKPILKWFDKWSLDAFSEN